MVLKKARQDKILHLIGQHEIQTQEELLSRLEESGYPVTQATVSRDIRELNLVKSLSSRGIYRYTAQEKEGKNGTLYGNVLSDSVTSVDFAGNMAVIKTDPGLASAVAAYLDSLSFSEVLGTIAGDDAIFVVVRDVGKTELFCEKIRTMMRKRG